MDVCQPTYCYPNPSNSEINIEYENGINEACDLKIFDVYGQNILTVQNFSGTVLQIDTKIWKRGMYFYRLNLKYGKEARGKFVLE